MLFLDFMLLEITINDQLTFKTHTEFIYRMVQCKLGALERI